MNLREFMASIADTSVDDWVMISRPTYRHRFTPEFDDEGNVTRLDADQHMVSFVNRLDIAVTMSYGLVQKGNYIIEADLDIARENARSLILDCCSHGRLVHREIMLKADRQRCILPMPEDWSDKGRKIPSVKVKLARLIHTLAGPPTDFDTYFQNAGFEEVDAPWP